MKKEKNFLKSLLAGVCAASLLFGAVSCANSDDDDSTTTPVKTPTPAFRSSIMRKFRRR